MRDLAEEFCRLGHDVTVLAPDPTISEEFTLSSEDGIRVLRVKTGKIDGASRLFRGINEGLLSSILWLKARKYLKAGGYDLVVWYSPSIFFGALVMRLKKFFGCRTYLILRDIFPQWAVDTGVLKEGFLTSFFRRKEILQYDAADTIGVQSPGNLAYFAERGLSDRYRLEVLYNWVRIETAAPKTDLYRERLGLMGKVVYFYGGNIGVAQDMDNIVRLAERLQNEPAAYFLLVGDGSEAERIKQLIAHQGLKNISVHPPVDQKTYLDMLSEFDVGLISLDKKFKTQNFPGKMLGYMTYSIPILASINPGNDLQQLLEDKSAGLVSINGDDAGFMENAAKFLKDPALRTAMGQNGRALLENNFSVSKAARQILDSVV